MAIFNATPVKPLKIALRLYWFQFMLLLLEPLVARLLTDIVPLPGVRIAVAGPVLLFALWPVAFKDAPITYWLLACASWFITNLIVLAFLNGVVGA